MTKEKTIAAAKAQKQLTQQTLSRGQFPISQYLSRVKFSPRLWGVDEAEVWRALETLCQMYENALTMERGKRELAERKAGEESPDG